MKNTKKNTTVKKLLKNYPTFEKMYDTNYDDLKKHIPELFLQAFKNNNQWELFVRYLDIAYLEKYGHPFCSGYLRCGVDVQPGTGSATVYDTNGRKYDVTSDEFMALIKISYLSVSYGRDICYKMVDTGSSLDEFIESDPRFYNILEFQGQDSGPEGLYVTHN